MTIMQNKTPEQPQIQDVINRYAPVSGGSAGFLGTILNAVARVTDSKKPDAGAPTPDVIYQSRNLAGQVIMTNNLEVASTFKRMESALQRGFAKATGENASAGDRQEFVSLTEQVQKDAEIIAAACMITKPEGAAKYKFTIEPQPGQHIPLKDAFASVQSGKQVLGKGVEFLRFGSQGQVVMMRPAGGFRAASRKTPTA